MLKHCWSSLFSFRYNILKTNLNHFLVRGFIHIESVVFATVSTTTYNLMNTGFKTFKTEQCIVFVLEIV